MRVFVDVCLDVNQGGTNRNRCTQRLVILHVWATRLKVLTRKTFSNDTKHRVFLLDS